MAKKRTGEPTIPADVYGRSLPALSVKLRGPLDKGHGWREVWVQDPDGYVWAVGTAIERTDA